MPQNREVVPPSMSSLQESEYGSDRDYRHGSPHLSHSALRRRIERDLGDLVKEQLDRDGKCRVVEVGGGHGTFTDCLTSAGAEVVVTEMSAPSAERLAQRFRAKAAVSVVYDPDGTRSYTEAAKGCDLVVFVSVLHHIPDYLAAVAHSVQNLRPGGAFYCVQDPLWYPRRGRMNLALDRGAYFAWRTLQGDLKRGLGTRWRRLRGRYDVTKSSDMVEYHVVRQGVDEEAIGEILEKHFSDVRVWKYWSTQSSVLQRLGTRLGLVSTFGFSARGRIC